MQSQILTVKDLNDTVLIGAQFNTLENLKRRKTSS